MKFIASCFILVTIVLTGGCTTLPSELQGTAAPLRLAEVSAHPENYRGQTVRWGGTILKVENAPNETRIQILARPLDRSGRPRGNAEPEGRFLSVTPTFLDPEIYTPGRALTVVGHLDGTREITVGQRKIRIPVVAADRWHLWPRLERMPTVRIYPYFWYNFGWYYPWGPCCWY